MIECFLRMIEWDFRMIEWDMNGMAIEIVSCPIKNGGSFHSYAKLPEGAQLL